MLNNDVHVTEGWLEGLLEAYELDEKIGMVGPVTNFISGRQKLETTYTSAEDMHLFAEMVKKQNKGKVTPRRRIAGFVVFMEKEIYEAVGGLDESYGIW